MLDYLIFLLLSPTCDRTSTSSALKSSLSSWRASAGDRSPAYPDDWIWRNQKLNPNNPKPEPTVYKPAPECGNHRDPEFHNPRTLTPLNPKTLNPKP